MKYVLKVLFLLSFIRSNAQDEFSERCVSYKRKMFSQLQIDSLDYLLKTKYPKDTKRNLSKRTESVFRIPVFFHIVHNNPLGELGEGANITEAQIKSQIEVLNQDFRKKTGTPGYNSNVVGADVEIDFFLATTDNNCMATKGISRHYYPQKAVFSIPNEETILKSIGYLPNDKFLNIWVASLSGGVLGYAPFPNNSNLTGLENLETEPELDGIIINHKTVGSRIGTSAIGSDSYAYGRTTTHEIGHWLGLFHTWGAGNTGCEDDHCNDTPLSNGGNQTKNNCAEKFSNCNNNGPTRVMIENYMDYSEDKCMNIFTLDQKNRMKTALANSPERAALANSPGHNQQIISTDFPTQNFNTLSAISDINWSVLNSINSLTGWKLETTNANQKNLLVENNSNTVGNKSILQTIFYDLPTSAGENLAVIDFDVSYPEVSDTDTLIISIYTGCQTLPIVIKTIIEADLRSNNLPKNHVVNIPKLPSNIDYLKLQFENHSKGKADLRIDNIKLNKPFSSAVKLDAKLLYSDELKPIKIIIHATDSSDLNFEIVDLLGRKHISYNQPFNYTGEYDLPQYNLENGLYFLRIFTKNAIFSTKIIMKN